MISSFLTQDNALRAINGRLKRVGLEPISRATFYRLRDLYVLQYPKSQWLSNGRLIYSEPVTRYLYFLARLHAFTQSFRMTEMAARGVVSKLPGRFSEAFSSFSDIDTFFINNMAA